MNTFLIILGIYLIGYIFAYYTSKLGTFIWCKIDNSKFDWSWDDIKLNCQLSVLSWLWVLALILMTLIYFSEKRIKSIKFKIKLPKTPPKWL